MTLQLLQRDDLVNGAQACGPLDPKSVDAPDNALLYLSLRGSGVITYKCVEANKPVVLEEEADLTETLSKGWTGKVETKDGARYDVDPEDDLPGGPPARLECACCPTPGSEGAATTAKGAMMTYDSSPTYSDPHRSHSILSGSSRRAMAT